MRLACWLCSMWIPLATAYVEDIPSYEQFEATALRHQLDPKALYSMALAESGHWHDNEFIPHPYAISLGVDSSIGQLKHEGFYPETKEEAEAILSQLINAGYSNIGVGMMQVNIKANPDIVEDYLSLLDPEVNLSSASKVLKWCRRYEQPADVFACYSHGSAESDAGKTYASRVLSYAQEFGQSWEVQRLKNDTGIYSFDEFVRIYNARSTRTTINKPARTPAAISIVTQ